MVNCLNCVQGLQRESADRLAAKHRAEKELATVQEANKGLQAAAAKAEEARQGLVPAGELAAAQSALSSAEKRIADLERELREAREEASSADGRAKAAIAAAEEDRKVSRGEGTCRRPRGEQGTPGDCCEGRGGSLGPCTGE